MREHQSQPKKSRVLDIFSSPMPTRNRHQQLENSAPFLSDLSPLPIAFSNRPLLSNPPVNMEMIQTPMANLRYIAAQSMIESIIDWDQPKAPMMHGRQNAEEDEEDEDEMSCQQSGSSQNGQQYEQSFEAQQQEKNETPVKATRQKKQQPEQSSSEEDMPKSRNKHKNFPIQKIQASTGQKKVTCNCKKTKCLKLYCDCFRINQTCDGCNCVGCHNTPNYDEQRNNAILTLMERNQQGFKPKIEGDQHSKGCNCKKSGCLKKYCECYQAGLKCCQLCKCQDCKNKVDGHDHHKDKPKRQSREIMLRQLASSISPIKQPRSASKMVSRTTAKKQRRFQQFVNL